MEELGWAVLGVGTIRMNVLGGKDLGFEELKGGVYG